MLAIAVAKIAAAGLLGLIIGKASKSDPGARLFALVAMGSALMSVVSTEFFKLYVLPGMIDPGVSPPGHFCPGFYWQRHDLAGGKQGARYHCSRQLVADRHTGDVVGSRTDCVFGRHGYLCPMVLFLSDLIDIDKILGPETENMYVQEKPHGKKRMNDLAIDGSLVNFVDLVEVKPQL